MQDLINRLADPTAQRVLSQIARHRLEDDAVHM